MLYIICVYYYIITRKRFTATHVVFTSVYTYVHMQYKYLHMCIVLRNFVRYRCIALHERSGYAIHICNACTMPVSHDIEAAFFGHLADSSLLSRISDLLLGAVQMHVHARCTCMRMCMH